MTNYTTDQRIDGLEKLITALTELVVDLSEISETLMSPAQVEELYEARVKWADSAIKTIRDIDKAEACEGENKCKL